MRFWHQLAEASWWIFTARLGTGVARLLVVLESRPRETRFVSDLLVGLVSIATCLATIDFAFRVPAGALPATSGVIAIVLGSALQNTLSDVFSGIAVGIERPYGPGDAIRVEGGLEGVAAQANWRSTHIATNDHNLAITPNSVMAKARLVNRSQPTALCIVTDTTPLASGAMPERCHEPLIAALRSCCLTLDQPASWTACMGLKGDGVSWDIDFSVERAEMLFRTRTEVPWQVHRHLRHAGIAMAIEGSASPTLVSGPSLEQLLRSRICSGRSAARTAWRLSSTCSWQD